MRWGAVIVAAGRGRRMGAADNKVFLPIAGRPVLAHTLEAFERCGAVETVAVVAAEGEIARVEAVIRAEGFGKVRAVVPGGAERQDSVYAGLAALETEGVLVHDAARPLVTPEQIEACCRAAETFGAAAFAVPVKDTIKVTEGGMIVSTPDRASLLAVQTPQAFGRLALIEAHRAARGAGAAATDDAMLFERLGGKVAAVPGHYTNLKITTPEDLLAAELFLERRRGETTERMIRVGQGFDVHQLTEGRPCIIGGVNIPYEKGLAGHSDADVLLHAISDAVLGALGLGDIGKHFPDTDPAYKDADSLVLLKRVWALAKDQGYALGNADATIIAQAPKMAPHIPEMVRVIAGALEADVSQVNVKATTTERLGFPGRGEGIAAQAVVLLVRRERL